MIGGNVLNSEIKVEIHSAGIKSHNFSNCCMKLVKDGVVVTRGVKIPGLTDALEPPESGEFPSLL